MGVITAYLYDTTTLEIINSIQIDTEIRDTWIIPDGAAFVPRTVSNPEIGGTYDPNTQIYTPPSASSIPTNFLQDKWDAATTNTERINVLAQALGIETS